MAKQCNLAHRIQARRIGALDRLQHPSDNVAGKIGRMEAGQLAAYVARRSVEILTLKARI